jgi:hypothetical protein
MTPSFNLINLIELILIEGPCPLGGLRWVPGGDIKMVVLDIGVEAAMGRNYTWLRAVRCVR